MLRHLLFLSVLLLAFASCNEELIETVPSQGGLEFSSDTVFLDTVFTNISSSTRTFKVYNRSKANITIPSIKLGRGEQSFYRLNVDGIPGKSFENIVLLARDSLFVFVEATVDYTSVNNPLYLDSIVFDSGDRQQEVKLVTLVQDAHFLYPARDAEGIKEKIIVGTDAEGREIAVDGFYLEGDAVWGSDKPYVIYGYVGVNSGNKLVVEKGARIHFHQNSGLLVEKGGTIKVKGTLEEKVVFEGDRLEPFFDDIPGQWGAIWLRAGSKDHEIDNAVIRNGTIGILMDSVGDPSRPSLRISNSEIYNTSNFGLLGRSAHIEGANLVIGNNGQSSLACLVGGKYRFTHCTFANYWTGSIRNYPAVLLSNFAAGVGSDGSQVQVTRDLEAADLINCIVEGNRGIEFLLEMDESAAFSYEFKNSLLRFDDPGGNYADDPLYDFEDIDIYVNNIFNGYADFISVPENDLRIGAASEAIGMADAIESLRVPTDLVGKDRTRAPDIGAYQHLPAEE